MNRIRALAYAAMATCLFAGCKQDQTGVHVHVHLGSISYDELRFGVLQVGAGDSNGAPMLLVDPEGSGRKAGLSGGRDQDVVILLDDNVDGKAILCDVAALSDGSPAGSGDGTVQAYAHQIRDVDVYISAAPTSDASAPGDAGNPGDGGATGTGGVDGVGGGSGTGGTTGTGGVTGAGGRTGSGGAIADAGRVDAPTDGGASGVGGAGVGGASGVGGAGIGGASGVGGATGTGGKTGTGALGSMCATGGQCASTFCADGVCCDSACTGACTTCNFNAGQAGRCRQSMATQVDPHHVCVNAGPNGCTDGTCTNTGTCTQKAFGTTCAPACASPVARSASGICSQAGSCLGVGTISCPAAMPSCVAPNTCH